MLSLTLYLLGFFMHDQLIGNQWRNEFRREGLSDRRARVWTMFIGLLWPLFALYFLMKES